MLVQISSTYDPQMNAVPIESLWNMSVVLRSVMRNAIFLWHHLFVLYSWLGSNSRGEYAVQILLTQVHLVRSSREV